MWCLKWFYTQRHASIYSMFNYLDWKLFHMSEAGKRKAHRTGVTWARKRANARARALVKKWQWICSYTSKVEWKQDGLEGFCGLDLRFDPINWWIMTICIAFEWVLCFFLLFYCCCFCCIASAVAAVLVWFQFFVLASVCHRQSIALGAFWMVSCVHFLVLLKCVRLLASFAVCSLARHSQCFWIYFSSKKENRCKRTMPHYLHWLYRLMRLVRRLSKSSTPSFISALGVSLSLSLSLLVSRKLFWILSSTCNKHIFSTSKLVYPIPVYSIYSVNNIDKINFVCTWPVCARCALCAMLVTDRRWGVWIF